MLSFNWSASTARLEAQTGVVAVSTFSMLETSEPVTLISARPVRVDDGIEVLASRVNYLRRARDGFGISGYPGHFCTDRWPPKGFGPTSPVEGLELFPGDHIAITFFARATEAGEWTAEGLEIAYSKGDGREARARASSESRHRQIIVAAERAEELPEGGMNCNPTTPSAWLGDVGVNDRVEVSERRGA